MKKDRILLEHGSGGKRSQQLIKEFILKYLQNDKLSLLRDASIFQTYNGRMAFTTDSFVVNPIIFPGGDIGKIAICGTINDLAVVGAIPQYLSLALIIEEGLEIELLEQILHSVKLAANEARVEIITGDTKVVNRGAADKIFINTSGIGFIPYTGINLDEKNIQEGDKIIVSGTIGDHGAMVMLAREKFYFKGDLKSDCAPLNGMINQVLNFSCCGNIKFMRDPTRGGLAATLNEIAWRLPYDFVLEENKIPVQKEIRGVCDLLGLDPFCLANEGKVVMIVSADSADSILKILRMHSYGKNAEIIGEVKKGNGRVLLKTQIGTERIIDMPVGLNLPRIC